MPTSVMHILSCGLRDQGAISSSLLPVRSKFEAFSEAKAGSPADRICNRHLPYLPTARRNIRDSDRKGIPDHRTFLSLAAQKKREESWQKAWILAHRSGLEPYGEDETTPVVSSLGIHIDCDVDSSSGSGSMAFPADGLDIALQS
ncbi:hypothetical protein DL770_000454 [Monosporascus sp. CRB-9-2]|nr:hypothetical protein DL770_000454 [Monosporascus sp. CRB-9-2]